MFPSEETILENTRVMREVAEALRENTRAMSIAQISQSITLTELCEKMGWQKFKLAEVLDKHGIPYNAASGRRPASLQLNHIQAATLAMEAEL